MVLRKTVYALVKRLFFVFLALVAVGSVWNASLDTPSAFGLLVAIIGWSGATTTGALMATRKVVCPRCQTVVIPARGAAKTPCQYCTN